MTHRIKNAQLKPNSSSRLLSFVLYWTVGECLPLESDTKLPLWQWPSPAFNTATRGAAVSLLLSALGACSEHRQWVLVTTLLFRALSWEGLRSLVATQRPFLYFSSNAFSTQHCRLNGLSSQSRTRWQPLALSIETQEIASGMELLELSTKRNYRKEASSFCSREQRLLKDRTGSASLCAENTAVPPGSSTTQVPLTAVWKDLYLPTTAKAELLAAPHTWIFLPLY